MVTHSPCTLQMQNIQINRPIDLMLYSIALQAPEVAVKWCLMKFGNTVFANMVLKVIQIIIIN